MTTKSILGRIQQKRDTTANWNAARGFIPKDGEIIIYVDREQKDGHYVPGIKVGDGLAYVQDLPFVDEYVRDMIVSHINNVDIHITEEERNRWNNKITTSNYISGESLVLTRD